MRHSILNINNFDLWSTFGGILVGDYIKAVIQHPSLKEPPKNEWHEIDGIEVDLSNPVLDSREFELTFHFTNKADYDEFYIEITKKSYTHFRFLELDRDYNLRVVSVKLTTLSDQWYEVKIKFADDAPLIYSELIIPNYGGSGQDNGYIINDINFQDYGLTVLRGTDENVQSHSIVRENLIVESNYSNGVVYHDSKVKYKDKEIKLNLMLKTDTTAELLTAYDTLIHNLIAPEGGLLITPFNSKKCYYKKNQIKNIFLPNIFELELTIVEYESSNYRGEDLIFEASKPEKVSAVGEEIEWEHENGYSYLFATKGKSKVYSISACDAGVKGTVDLSSSAWSNLAYVCFKKATDFNLILGDWINKSSLTVSVENSYSDKEDLKKFITHVKEVNNGSNWGNRVLNIGVITTDPTEDAQLISDVEELESLGWTIQIVYEELLSFTVSEKTFVDTSGRVSQNSGADLWTKQSAVFTSGYIEKNEVVKVYHSDVARVVEVVLQEINIISAKPTKTAIEHDFVLNISDNPICSSDDELNNLMFIIHAESDNALFTCLSLGSNIVSNHIKDTQESLYKEIGLKLYLTTTKLSSFAEITLTESSSFSVGVGNNISESNYFYFSQNKFHTTTNKGGYHNYIDCPIGNYQIQDIYLSVLLRESVVETNFGFSQNSRNGMILQPSDFNWCPNLEILSLGAYDYVPQIDIDITNLKQLRTLHFVNYCRKGARVTHDELPYLEVINANYSGVYGFDMSKLPSLKVANFDRSFTANLPNSIALDNNGVLETLNMKNDRSKTLTDVVIPSLKYLNKQTARDNSVKQSILGELINIEYLNLSDLYLDTYNIDLAINEIYNARDNYHQGVKKLYITGAWNHYPPPSAETLIKIEELRQNYNWEITHS